MGGVREAGGERTVVDYLLFDNIITRKRRQRHSPAAPFYQLPSPRPLPMRQACRQGKASWTIGDGRMYLDQVMPGAQGGFAFSLTLHQTATEVAHALPPLTMLLLLLPYLALGLATEVAHALPPLTLLLLLLLLLLPYLALALALGLGRGLGLGPALALAPLPVAPLPHGL